VRHVDGRDLEVPLQPPYLRAHLHSQLGVQVRQRLVHQKGLGLTHDDPPHRNPLPLAAGKVARLAVEVLGQAEQFSGLLDAAIELAFGHLA